MKIPKRFQIFGQPIEVEYQDDLVLKEHCYGWTIYLENKIILQSPTKEYPLSEIKIERCFWHEVVHLIFYYLKEKKLGSNEKLIDLIASLLQQILGSFEYEEKTKGKK